MGPEWNFDPDDDPRQLDITDLERIERFKEAGYGGSAADALYEVGCREFVFDQDLLAVSEGEVLAGRALPVKLHTYPKTDAVESRNSKSKISKFSRLCSGEDDIGTAETIGCSRSHRSATWAGVLPWRSATAPSVASSRTSPTPSGL